MSLFTLSCYFRSSLLTPTHSRPHDLLRSVVSWLRLRSLPGFSEVFMASAVPEQRDARCYQHNGLDQRSAPSHLCDDNKTIPRSLRFTKTQVLVLSTGFGFQLLVDMIRSLPVTHVVQLSHSGTTQCSLLTPEFLRMAHGYQTHPPAQSALDEFAESHCPHRTFSHIMVESEFQGVGQQGTA